MRKIEFVDLKCFVCHIDLARAHFSTKENKPVRIVSFCDLHQPERILLKQTTPTNIPINISLPDQWLEEYKKPEPTHPLPDINASPEEIDSYLDYLNSRNANI
jgi:hypothetical protein